MRSKSLEDVYSTVAIDQPSAWRRMFAFMGPAYMVSVGYMDPGNWATDLAGGSQFAYQLLWVLLLSNMMAVLLQTLSARLGIVSGRDLAQACREQYSRPVVFALWILCEIAIAACDVAEVIGTVLGLNLLFGIPLEIGIIITIFDTFLLLLIQRLGIRKMEAFILVLVITVGLCFLVQVLLAQPEWGSVIKGLLPSLSRHSPFVFSSSEALYIAIGILGATVMPHNLYLHSALVQSRNITQSPEGKRTACRYNFIDSVVALNTAFFVNASILILAASVFFANNIVVNDLRDAHKLLPQFLGGSLAASLFAIALLCAGQSSTLTGTLAGQIIMEGFVHIKMRPWLRRLLTRSLAIIPSAIVIYVFGGRQLESLLILSQVILSLQLSFAVVPLIQFTSDSHRMGEFANALWVRILAWVVAVIIIGLNAMLVVSQIHTWRAQLVGSGYSSLWIDLTAIPISGACAVLLLWLIVQPALQRKLQKSVEADHAAATGRQDARSVVRRLGQPLYRRIGVAVENVHADAKALQHAVALAKSHKASLYLLHVVDGVGGQWYGEASADSETKADHAYLEELANELCAEGIDSHACLRYGKPTEELISAVNDLKLDFLVMRSHGHGFLLDLFLGQTIETLRHRIHIPILAIRESQKSEETTLWG